ncbi:unnamed protein product [Arctia plantaginis]|uniref:Uncharacterized protein n=1 Tax=Arctia plantaginis TaxID=874455 RepID=A0A8S1AHH4_ARCPL|nr:unnamed protein product [Arctia plantaginis]CAB3260612.1 unnamed protein product [Arctia plantaginis]
MSARAHVTHSAISVTTRPAPRRASHSPAPRATTDSVINKPYRCLLVGNAASLTSRPRTLSCLHASLFTYKTTQMSATAARKTAVLSHFGK